MKAKTRKETKTRDNDKILGGTGRYYWEVGIVWNHEFLFSLFSFLSLFSIFLE